MPLYAFTCARCGGFELARPMAAAAQPATCLDCGRAAARVFTAPALRRLDRPLRRALDGEDRSAHQPTVVSSDGRIGSVRASAPR